MNGVDLNTVRELLGHKSMDMTLRYAHLSADHKRHAVEELCKTAPKQYLFSVLKPKGDAESLRSAAPTISCRTAKTEIVVLAAIRPSLRSGSSGRLMLLRLPASPFLLFRFLQFVRMTRYEKRTNNSDRKIQRRTHRGNPSFERRERRISSMSSSLDFSVRSICPKNPKKNSSRKSFV